MALSEIWSLIASHAQVLTAVATIVLAIVAVFGPSIGRWWRRPKLKVEVKKEPPHCHKTFMGGSTPETGVACYYFRILVKNVGKTSAKNVEVFTADLKKCRGEGLQTVSSFVPMNLRWSNTEGGPPLCLYRMLFPAIHPGAWKHCDVFHVVYPSGRNHFDEERYDRNDVSPERAVLSFNTIALPNTKGYLQPPGDYSLKVIVGAENAKAVPRTLRIKMDGTWIDEEIQMLDNVTFHDP